MTHSKSSNNSSRRNFLTSSAAVAGGVWLGTAARPTYASPLQQLTGACIGVGGKGSSDTSHIAEMGVKLVGLCDVDRGNLDKKGKEFPDAAKYQDFRKMLDALGDKVDCVGVSTPDHTHAVAAIKAMKMGKHVYCQKPLTWSIREARTMREVAAETGVVTQMGNQGTSEDGLRTAVEIIRSGAIGDVRQVHVWTNRPVWPQGVGRPKRSDAVPAELDWDSWIGPAQMRPFVGGKTYHDFNWRGWLDFGTGALGDMACHTTNFSVMALQLWDPIAVTAVKNSGIVEGETYPSNTMLKFEFPERDGLVPCEFFWYDGGNLPSDDIISKLPDSFRRRVEKQKTGGRKTSAAVVVGDKGMLFSPDDYGAKWYLLPKDEFAEYTPPTQSLPRIGWQGGTDQRQKWEFVESCKGEYEPGTMSNFGYAGRLTETILVGNLALRVDAGQRIEWDAKALRSTNVESVNKFVQREYRDGWSLEG